MNEHSDASLERDRLVLARRKEHLMSEILTTPSTVTSTRRSPLRRRPAQLALTLAVVGTLTAGTLIATSTSGGPTGNGPTAFAIEKLPSGPVRIKVVDTEATAAQMTRQLKEQGYNISIQTVPASPDMVGRWFGFGQGGQSYDSPDAKALEAQLRGDLATLVVPEGLYRTGIALDIGRAPHKGEHVGVTGYTNALAPDNALFCLRLSGETPQIAAARLAAAGYRAHWRVTADTPQTGPQFQDQIKASYHDTVPATGYVIVAYNDNPLVTPDVSPHDVYVTVVAHKSTIYNALVWLNYPLEQEQSGVRDYSSCPSAPN